MLNSIEIKNINAIDHCIIDFEKAKYQYKDEMIFHDKLVNPVAFYGTNGSGKSSFLKAISQLIGLMINESDKLHGFISNHINLQKEINKAFNGKNKISERELINLYDRVRSSITLNFTLEDNNYIYHIETSQLNRITSEYLLSNNKSVFKRENNVYYYNKTNNIIEASLYPLIRKLANKEIYNDEKTYMAYNFLSNMSYIDDAKRYYQFKIAIEKSYLDLVVDKSKQVKEILSKYSSFPIYEICSRPNANIEGGKEYFAKIDISNGQFELPYAFLSTGMENQSALLSFVLTLPNDSVMFIDEIEDALHPMTILNFINVVKEKNIQLVFSSHNTFILQKLRPDQIYFANWKDGFSRYKKLSEIYPNIREINNIEKMYLSALFDEDINADE